MSNTKNKNIKGDDAITHCRCGQGPEVIWRKLNLVVSILRCSPPASDVSDKKS